MTTDPNRILYEDNRYLIVNKPAGMPTAGDKLEQPGSLQYVLMQERKRMVWAVHQLDRQTSGVNLFVKRKTRVEPAAQALKHGIKEYLAISSKLPGRTPDDFEIDEPLRFDPRLERHAVHADGKPARSRVRVLARAPDCALLRVRIHTGRTHQIRAHLEHLGVALLGDALYANAAHEGRAPRQMLHAWRVCLKIEDLPEQRFTAPIPTDMKEALEEVFEKDLLQRLLTMGE